MSELVRLRANPEKVRVAIRHLQDGDWKVTLSSRNDDVCVITAYDASAEMGVQRVLLHAAAINFDGIDLEMQRTYLHPWKGRTPT